MKDFINRRKIPEEERLRLNLESMTYTIMKHYGWNINEVENMNINQVRQAVSWANAMMDNEARQNKGEGVHLNYDNVPKLGE